jgi:DNA repair exonuclease SbcCD ATPase subunit
MADNQNESLNTNTNANNGGNEPSKTPPVSTINYEDLIAKARTEEKNKLYPEIEKFKAQVDEKVTKINELLISIATRDEDLKSKDAEINKLQEEITVLKEEGVKGMEKDKTVEELQKKVSALEKTLQDKDNEIASVKTQYELKEYRAEKIKDVDETVYDLVTGNTKEEIDASVEKAKAFYDKVASKFTQNNQNTQTNNPPLSSQIPPVNTNILGDFANIDDQAIRNMSPKEYAEYRKTLFK